MNNGEGSSNPEPGEPARQGDTWIGVLIFAALLAGVIWLMRDDFPVAGTALDPRDEPANTALGHPVLTGDSSQRREQQYADCVLQSARSTQNDAAARLIANACRTKFLDGEPNLRSGQVLQSEQLSRLQVTQSVFFADAGRILAFAASPAGKGLKGQRAVDAYWQTGGVTNGIELSIYNGNAEVAIRQVVIEVVDAGAGGVSRRYAAACNIAPLSVGKVTISIVETVPAELNVRISEASS